MTYKTVLYGLLIAVNFISLYAMWYFSREDRKNPSPSDLPKAKRVVPVPEGILNYPQPDWAECERLFNIAYEFKNKAINIGDIIIQQQKMGYWNNGQLQKMRAEYIRKGNLHFETYHKFKDEQLKRAESIIAGARRN